MANRVSQTGIEVVLLPTSQKARASQTGVETVMVPSPNTRISQAGVEAVWGAVPGALVSQVGVEVVAPVSVSSLVDVVSQVGVEVVSQEVAGGDPRATQTTAEAVSLTTSNARVTQVSPEAVLYPTDELARTTQMVIEVIWRGQQVTITVESECWEVVQTDFPMVAVSTE